jgi:hypothetical protein
MQKRLPSVSASTMKSGSLRLDARFGDDVVWRPPSQQAGERPAAYP